ncbi:MAG: cytochrome P450 [Novosphingobium sp.]|nr:cytochrome P450 [Novosphingobium sp.]
MGIAAEPAMPVIPDHVPPELVLPFDPWDNLADRPHEALARAQAFGRVVYSPRHHIVGYAPNGCWMVTRAKEARDLLLDTATFSSEHTTGIPEALGGTFKLAPIEADPPEHGVARGLLNPIFLPRNVRRFDGKARERAAALIEGFAARGTCDFVRDFAKILPSEMFLDLVGLPHERLPEFLEWEELIMGSTCFEDRLKGLRSVADYLRGEIRDRAENPADDVLSLVVNTPVEGRRRTEDEALGTALLLYIAGLDTVTNSLAWHFRHLAENPADQQFLRENPSEIPRAVEEMFRAYSIVSLTRRVVRDTEFHGVPMRAGDVVSLPTTLASRDEEEFAGAGAVDFRHGPRRHLTFGFGPHICIGMHLAKVEIVASIDVWLRTLPPFRVSEGEEIRCSGGAVLTVHNLPLTWA